LKDSVSLQNQLLNAGHVVCKDADSGFVAFLAVSASGNVFSVQDDFLHARSGFPGALQSAAQENITVSPDARTSHNAKYFHVFLPVCRNGTPESLLALYLFSGIL